MNCDQLQKESGKVMGTEVKGYKTTENAEQRYIQWVADCRYGRLELPTRTGVIPAMSGALTALAGPLHHSQGIPAHQ